MTETSSSTPVRVVGRYALYEEIAAGGMATVHFGRLLGPVGFSRTVAIKRLHPQFAKDPEFVSMFLDEARLAARIRHPNVVPTLDVVATAGELFLVMDYVQGESLSRLVRFTREKKLPVTPRMVCSVMGGVLNGLHAAHEARDEKGVALNIVHRDISPQNVLVGTDGIARILDFGVAKAAGRIQTTRDGQLKGKLAYMSPEQLEGKITRQVDIYAAAVVLWEALTGQRLFAGDNEAVILGKILHGEVFPPSKFIAPGLESPETLKILDDVVMKGLDRDPSKRYVTSREFAVAVERCLHLAPLSEVGEWVEQTAKDALEKRASKIAEIESTSSVNLVVNASQIAAQLNSDPPKSGRQRNSEGAAGETQVTTTVPKSPRLPGDELGSDVDVSRFTQESPRRKFAMFALIGALMAGVVLLGGSLFISKRDNARERLIKTNASAELVEDAGSPASEDAGSTVQTAVPPAIIEVAKDAGTPSSGPKKPPQNGGTWRPPPPHSTATTTTVSTAKKDCHLERFRDADGIFRYKQVCE